MGKNFSEKPNQNKPHNNNNSRPSKEHKFSKKTESFSKHPRQNTQAEKKHSSNWKPRNDFSTSSTSEKAHPHPTNHKPYHKSEAEKHSNNNNYNQANSWRSKKDLDKANSYRYKENQHENRSFNPQLNKEKKSGEPKFRKNDWPTKKNNTSKSNSNEQSNRAAYSNPRKDPFGSNTAGKKHTHSVNGKPHHKPEAWKPSNNNNFNQANSWESKRDPDRKKPLGYKKIHPKNKRFKPLSNAENNFGEVKINAHDWQAKGNNTSKSNSFKLRNSSDIFKPIDVPSSANTSEKKHLHPVNGKPKFHKNDWQAKKDNTSKPNSNEQSNRFATQNPRNGSFNSNSASRGALAIGKT